MSAVMYVSVCLYFKAAIPSRKVKIIDDRPKSNVLSVDHLLNEVLTYERGISFLYANFIE